MARVCSPTHQVHKLRGRRPAGQVPHLIVTCTSTTPMTVTNGTSRPTFDELKKRDGPYLNAWGIWGEGNEYGQTNLITAESVKRGVAAVEYGITINLK